jgi:hypothetical protein
MDFGTLALANVVDNLVCRSIGNRNRAPASYWIAKPTVYFIDLR